MPDVFNNPEKPAGLCFVNHEMLDSDLDIHKRLAKNLNGPAVMRICGGITGRLNLTGISDAILS